MESANMVVDDFNDFFRVFKKEEITSLLDEIIETSSAEQIVEAKSDIVATYIDIVSGQNVATFGDQNGDETKRALISVFDDPIRRELSPKIKKNHPSYLIIVNPSDSMVTRQRYVNLIDYTCYTSMIEPKNVKEALLNEF